MLPHRKPPQQSPHQFHPHRKQLLWPHLLLATLLCTATSLTAAPLASSVTRDDLDAEATIAWGAGETSSEHQALNDPSRLVWTDSTQPSANLNYGRLWKEDGPRHLRFGFKRAIPVGTIIAGATPGTRISILAEEAPYPGDPENDAHWQELESTQEGEILIALAPEGASTRAVRFSSEIDLIAMKNDAELRGVYILPERMANLAPFATPMTSAEERRANRLTNATRHGQWDAWSNLEGRDPGPKPVSESRPEWVMLTWPEPVELDGLATVWTGFGEALVQAYRGPSDVHPREATEEHWETVQTQEFSHHRGAPLGINFVSFEQPVETQSVRLLIKAPAEEGGSGVATLDGTRVWLGELMALHALGERSFAEVRPTVEELPPPPIPVKFDLETSGYVTLVINDAKGRRVRNLIAEEFFEAGSHTVYWDGMSDQEHRPARVLGQDGRLHEGVHGINEIAPSLVEPGEYSVSGLVRDEIRMHYQITVNHAGNPPWTAPEGTARWMADHSPPFDAVFVPGDEQNEPQMILASRVAEAGDGLIWTDLDGRKLRRVRWVGGAWTGASHLARDNGPEAVKGVQSYAGSTWNSQDKRVELRVTALLPDNTNAIINHVFDDEGHGNNLLRGLAAHNGLVFASLGGVDRLSIVDAKNEKHLADLPLPEPGGLAFDAEGRLLAISEGRLLRYDLTDFVPGQTASLPKPEVVVDKGLERPVGITVDGEGRIYVSDQGDAHDVKVFSPDGKLVRTIGTPGGPVAGPYDETRMHNPLGIAVDKKGQLWVAENDQTPKRVSLWTTDGEFVRAFYGPSQYGGGGTVDPRDPSRFYYARSGGNSSMEFQVDWETGEWKPAHVLYRRLPGDVVLPAARDGSRDVTGPQWPIYFEGKQYMTNAFNSNPTNGTGAVTIWQMRDGIAHPVASAGNARLWPLLREEAFAERWPEGTDPADTRGNANRDVFFVWSDSNNDGQVQPEEVTMRKLSENVGTVFVGEDLGLMTSHTYRIELAELTDEGIPLYDLASAKPVTTGLPTGRTSGGGEAIDAGEWVVVTGGPMRGFHNGELSWNYTSQWPGLHAGMRAPRSRQPGQLLATTRLVGQPIQPPGTDVQIWGINGNQGQIFLLTTDGLFVGTLGQGADSPQWRMSRGERGMRIDHVSLMGEHFWPTLTQPEEGPAMLVAGMQHNSIVTVEGLESIQRIPAQPLTVSTEDIANAVRYEEQLATLQLAREGRDRLRIPMQKDSVEIAGNPEDWKDADWTRVDDDTEATLKIAGDRLVMALRTRRHHNLLNNTGESLPMLFKTGGALDLMIGTDPEADPDRSEPVPGDQRLLVTRVDEEPVAVLYQAVVPGTPSEDAHGFSSPWRTVSIDRVTEVSEQIELAEATFDKDRNRYSFYEWSIPLSTLGWKPAPDQRMRGDIGLLRGRDGQTTARIYWQNQATNIVEDIPSEAALTPALWGVFEVSGD